MLFYVCTAAQLRCISAIHALCPPPLRRRIRPLSYQDLARAKHLPAGTWLFADIERLAPAEAERLAGVHAALRGAGWPVLNHPTLSRGRHELLRLLAGRGLNPYDVYLASEHRAPARYPVFLRRSVEHHGAESELLATPAALAGALADREAAGCSRVDTLIVEFCATADVHGVYRKYGAYYVNGEILPRHVLFGRQWMVKAAGSDLTDADAAEEWAYLQANPHREQLREIFALARIDYGRVDYGLRDGRPVVFEINTHPAHALVPPGAGDPRREDAREHFRSRFLAALDRLAQPIAGRPLPVPQARRKRWRPAWLRRLRQLHRRRRAPARATS